MQKPERIIVTGTPGTGKSTIGKKLAEALEKKFTEANDLVKDNGLYTGKKKDSLIVDLNGLKDNLEGVQGVISGGILCNVSLEADFVFVLRTDPEELRGRLEEKGWDKEKIEENLEAEAVDYCVVHSIKNYGKEKVFEIDTTSRKVKDAVEEIKGFIEGRKKGKRHFDWSKFFQ